jgi:dTDP-4-dehydrorhamnose reductase
LKLLITGREGQLGGELERVLQPLGEVRAVDRQGLDLSQPDSISAAIRSFQPEVIINAAAYTAVDQAESEQAIAQAVNATAPAVLADEAIRLGALLIHYSTDYVFDGTKDSPYHENDPAHPLSVYGQTKWQGEQAIRASGCRHFIFRTSWVYSPRGKSFMLTMLRLLREKPQISVVDDQIGTPTSTALLARATLQALGQAQVGSGTYHLTASGSTSWCGFARLIAEAGGLTSTRIVPIPSSAYPTAARRPLNSRLDCSRFVSNFGMQLPAWDREARRIVAEILAASRACTTGAVK